MPAAIRAYENVLRKMMMPFCSSSVERPMFHIKLVV